MPNIQVISKAQDRTFSLLAQMGAAELRVALLGEHLQVIQRILIIRCS